MGPERFRLSDAAALLGAEREGADRPFPFSVALDSREVAAGGAFAALPGDRTDGHLFLEEATRRGASVLLLRRDRRQDRSNRTGTEAPSRIFVEDVETALVRLARFWQDQVAPRVFGITGSVGKTTTRELIRGTLQHLAPCHGAPKSYNTRIGCASTVLAMPPETKNLVLEYGTSHPGEIADLVEAFPPQELFLTEVCPAHLQGLGSLEGVLAAKLELLRSPRRESLTYNADNDRIREALNPPPEGLLCLGVGRKRGEIRILSCDPRWSADGPVLALRLRRENRVLSLESRLWGEQHAYAWAFAWSVALRFGVPDEAVGHLAATCQPLPGRGRILRGRRGCWVLDESYNANPASTAAALRNLKVLAAQLPGPGWAVLGGMKELGATSPQWHRRVLEDCRGLEGVLLVGQEWETLKEELPSGVRWFPSVEALQDLENLPWRDEGLVLLKGSRSYRLEQLLPRLTEES